MSKDSKIPEIQELPRTGLLRIKQVLRFIPISRSSWWSGVKAGIYPKPIKLSERVTVWRASDIRNLIEGINQSLIPPTKLFNKRVAMEKVKQISDLAEISARPPPLSGPKSMLE